MKNLRSVQITKIHIAKQQLKLSDDNYHAILSSFNNADGKPCSSSKELNGDQADILLNLFKTKFGWQEKQSGKKEKVKKRIVIVVPPNRPDKFATQSQINMLAGLWVEHSRAKDENSFIKFISSIVKINHPTWLLKEDVQKVKLAIESLGRK